MLVLTRKPNQSIKIGDNITINVVRVRGNTIQLGIEAPQDVSILRSELLLKTVLKPNSAAAPSDHATRSDGTRSPQDSTGSSSSDSEEKTPANLSLACSAEPIVLQLLAAS
ncbi:carbon storage regulator [Aureliella helgolandensis]|uniref:Translational regulator CsrA n=1 Tax=Aureliella helgolandensis TaxID=2527968 RepID=A0A518GHS0_9BACT|nr:carbon storage regulator [Aureliella helgolandensis]QDV28118.1 hypothetical protein Q31a_65130 [Aureliella helgolandensis]